MAPQSPAKHSTTEPLRSQYYVPKSSILLAGTGVRKISSVACGFSSIKIDYLDYPKSLISIIDEFYAFSIKYRYSDILLKKKEHKLHLSCLFSCNHTCYCVNMVSVKSNDGVTLSPALSK